MRKEQKSVGLTMKEKELIEEAAKSIGLSYGSFLRSCALEKALEIKRGKFSNAQ